jgi:hypothetical protein
MRLEFTNEEIWEAWKDIIENPQDCSISSVVIIRKVIEKATNV